MSILTDLQAALAPVTQQLADQLGVLVDLSTRTLTRAADGEQTETWVVDPTGVDLPAFFVPLSADAAQKAFGVQSRAKAMLRLSTFNGVLPNVEYRDAFRVQAGPFTGTTWLAEAKGQPDSLGVFVVVPLVDTPAGAVIP